MKSPVVLAALALSIVLAGCAPTGGPTTDPDPDPKPTESVVPEPTEPPAIVIGIDDVQLVDGSGGVTSTAAMTDADAMLELFTTALGAAPAPDSTEFGDAYQWPEGVTVIVVGGEFAAVRYSESEADGYLLRTSDGITVGSTRAEVEAFGPFDDGFDSDGDGGSDVLGLEPREEPGTESLTSPGEVGTSYITVFFDGDTVSGIGSPGGDWRDL